MLEQPGPSLAYRIIAICGFAGNLVCIILKKDLYQAQHPDHTALNYRLLMRLEIRLVLGWGCLRELSHIALLFSLPSHASRIGLIGALLSLGLMIGRRIVGHSSDALGRLNMATLTTWFCASISLTFCILARLLVSYVSLQY